MTFSAPRFKDFPCLQLAYEAGKAGGIMPCVLNAANEVAVHAFMQKKTGFTGIPEIIAATVGAFSNCPAVSIEQLVAVDIEARQRAREFIGGA